MNIIIMIIVILCKYAFTQYNNDYCVPIQKNIILKFI